MAEYSSVDANALAAELGRYAAPPSTMKMMKLLAATVSLAATIGMSSVISAQSIAGASHQAPPSALTLRGPNGRDHQVTAADLATLRRRDTTVTVHQVTGRYSGVLLADLLSLIHVPRGDSLRGTALRTYVVVVGADGYQVVFALAEFDPRYTDRIAILADTKDAKALPASEGPFRLIVPGERRPARWVRQVVRIEVRDAP